ncbi:MAG: class II aldolase/adducin family protein [Bifidobacteriaceae bacterium]|jgi:rhamnulose-1-phosphate aldolase|nr:class II aldolase/adducin family protein [Bifidobacteriaceae bacterium]
MISQITIPSLDQALAEMGAAGLRLDAMGSCEASAGNISVALAGGSADGLDGGLDGGLAGCLAGQVERLFPNSEPYELPVAAEALAGWTVLVTGSGSRLRDIAAKPGATVGAVTVGPDGCGALLRTAPDRGFATPTSEFNSHLAVHVEQVAARGLTWHAVVHAQPPHLVALSHRPDLADSADPAAFWRRIVRWEPETIVQLPEGVALLPFMVPGSEALGQASVEAMRTYRVVVWAKHGLLVRSEAGPLKAVDLIEYVETGAMYDQVNTACGSPSQGLTDAEIRQVADAFGVTAGLF